MVNIVKILISSIIITAFMAGCSTTHRATQSSRTAIEQLLISEAVMRSVSRDTATSLPIPGGSSVILKTPGLNSDSAILQQAIAGWLGQQGYKVQEKEEKATYRIDVLVESLGTEFGGNFVGMTPALSLPELSLFKSQYQTGYVKFHMNVYDLATGAFAGSTPPLMAGAYYNNYTILFLISFSSTDLPHLPQIGPFQDRKPH